MFHCPFPLFFLRSRCDTPLSLFASKWLYVSCYALMSCAMWPRGSWLGGSMVSAWCFVASLSLTYGLVILLFFPLFLQPHHIKIIQGYHKIIQCYHSCINLPMNWHLSRLCLAVLFWVAVFWWFAFGFCFRIVVTWWRPTGLCAGPIPVHSWGPQLADDHVCNN